MPDVTHPPVDEYLEAILELQEEGAKVIQARLADRLGVSAPSVSEMVRRLRADGYLEDSNERTLTLTPKGLDWATTIVRRHRLAERLLVDILGLPWHKAHIEACRWEHVISSDVEELIIAKLDGALTCPHGNPIPGMALSTIEVVPLSQTEKGQRIRLERVSEELEMDHEALLYLDQHGFIPGATGTVSTVAPDQTRVLDVGDSTIAIGLALAGSLYVSVQAA
jgi:DtxR family Mn-dependent transcriptional regulator